MIFGQWKPQRIALAALLFGFFRALGNVYTGFSFLKALNLPSSLYNMLPYIISLIVLAFTSKNSRAPKAEGIPLRQGHALSCIRSLPPASSYGLAGAFISSTSNSGGFCSHANG